MDNREIALGLRSKTIAKQQNISRLNIPSTIYSKQQLRTGLRGRVQRREHRRFIQKIEKQKKSYAKQKEALDKYLAKVESSEFGITVGPIPKTGFWETPKLKKVRY